MFSGVGTDQEDIANRLCLEQCERVLMEMTVFIDMSEREQRLRLGTTLPSIEEFWKYRLGSSAVAVCLALNEYVYGTLAYVSKLLRE